MAKEKEYEVKAQIGDKIVILPIRASNEVIAAQLADRVIKRKNTKPSRVISTTEKK